jgi:acetyl-CoA carboxylase carboxyl transferase subunit beta
MSIQDKLFITCPSCERRQLIPKWEKLLYVCPVCGKYLPLSADTRLKAVFDTGTMSLMDANMSPADPLNFPEYEEKVIKQQKKTGMKESAVCAKGSIGGIKAVCVVLDSHFFMGSMSSVVGEKVTRAIEYATKKKRPLIIFSASGGARMQEGIYSLMQMAKTADAIEEFSRQGGLYISYLTHPTTGGVTASFATLGDITLAEPGALVGFAGPRVIEQTIGKKLPKGFQRAEYLESHGFVDKIVERKDMRATLIDLLKLHQGSEHHGITLLQRKEVAFNE